MNPHESDDTGNRRACRPVYTRVPTWLPKTLTAEMEADLKQRALAEYKKTNPAPNSLAVTLETGGRRLLVVIHTAINGKPIDEIALYRATKKGELRPWQRSWKN